MELLEAMEARHAIRAYTDEPVAQDVLDALQSEIEACNLESGLHIQMAAGLDDAFLGLKTHYGRFAGVHNAIALIGRVEEEAEGRTGVGGGMAGGVVTSGVVTSGAAGGVADEASGRSDDRADGTRSGEGTDGADGDAGGTEIAADGTGAADGATRSILQSFKDADGTPVSAAAADLQERVGYYGERLVLRAVQLGLDTSWCVLDDAERARNPWWTLDEGEAVVWVIAFGHGARPGGRRRTKPMEILASVPGDDFDAAPEWFRAGMAAAMTAPTSLSQQPFRFVLCEAGMADGVEGGTEGGAEAGADGGTGNGAEAGIKIGMVRAEATDGLFAHVGLGCAQYHFELGALPHRVRWC